MRRDPEEPLPLPRWDRVEPEKKQAILAAARAEFIQNGLARASYNQIIEASGVSKGAMYYYFEDREDLLVTTFEDALQPVAALAALPEQVESAEAFWAMLGARTVDAMAWLDGRPELAALARALHEGLRGASRTEGPMARLNAALLGWIVRLLQLGTAVGAVRTDLPLDLLARLAFQVGVAMDSWMVERWEQLEPEEAMRLSVAGMGLFRDLLEPKTAPIPAR